MKDKGELVKRGRLSPTGDIEFWNEPNAGRTAIGSEGHGTAGTTAR